VKAEPGAKLTVMRGSVRCRRIRSFNAMVAAFNRDRQTEMNLVSEASGTVTADGFVSATCFRLDMVLGCIRCPQYSRPNC